MTRLTVRLEEDIRVRHLPKTEFAGGSGQEILRSGGVVFGKNFYGSE